MTMHTKNMRMLKNHIKTHMMNKKIMGATKRT